jgi:hypothetical protein
MLQRLDAMESELGALIESLRTGSNRLNADLKLLEGNLAEVRDAVQPRGRFEPEAGAAYDKAAALPEVEEVAETPVADYSAAAELAVEEEDGFDGAVASGASEDMEGARLIALNMALNGTPREETERYLSENFELSNRTALLDEVYASVEG